jgi:exoribonuclease-2
VQNAPDLSDLEPTDIEQLHRYRVLTRMRAATISLEPGLHGGLGVEPYCQTTSPLRRFLDLISQRQLVAIIDNKALPYSLDDLTELCPYVEERLRLINRLEQRRERYWIFHHLSQHRGQVFDALVLNIWDQRARIEIIDYALQVDMRISGQISAGELISVRLTRIDPWADDIQFVMEK